MWKRITLSLTVFALLGAFIWLVTGGKAARENSLNLLNVSYDPTRELCATSTASSSRAMRKKPVRG